MEAEPDALTIDYRDPFGVYRLIEPDIKRNLPLQNLHWHLPPRPLRSIPVLRINLVEDSPQHDPVAVKHQFAGLQVSPFVRLMVLQCDDLDIYRSTVRPIIREWLSTQVTPNKDQTEWLIIQVVPHGTQPGSSSRHLQNGTTPRFKTKIFDKIKSDFNESSSEDRCFQIRLDQPPGELEKSYGQLMTHLRDLVLEALSKRVRLYEEGMKKLEDQRMVPGWNFGAFFVTKEGLALSFTRISLLDDALALYDELEAMFLDLSSEKTSFLLSETGAPLPQSQSSEPFTAILRDPNVRSKIADNTITYFDFRVYLFSSQYSILMSIVRSRPPGMQSLRVSELLFRTRDFLTSVITTLENEGVSTGLLYPWACNVVDSVLDELIIDEDSKGIQDIADGRAELILLKRHALEVLGRLRGWPLSSLGGMESISLDGDEDSVEQVNDSQHDGHSELVQSLSPKYRDLLETQDSFIKGFTDITLQALRESEIADRIRLSDSLKAELAVLYYDQKKYSEAADLLNNLPKLYLSQGWDILSSSLQWIYSQCLYQLNDYKDYISAAFDLLRQSTPKNKTYVKLLFDQLEQLVRSDSAVHSVVPISGLAEEVIDPYIDFSNENSLPTVDISIACHFDNWPCDNIELIMVSTEIPGRMTSFRSKESESINISRSSSVYKLYSKTFVLGTFKPQAFRVQYGSVVLEKVFEHADVILVYPPPECLSVDIGVPRSISLEEGGKVTVDIESPTSGFESATLIIRGSTAGLRMFTGPVVYYQKSGDGFEELDSQTDVSEVLKIGRLLKHSMIRIVIPYSMEKELSDIKINWELEWITEDNQKLSMLDTYVIPVSLPISVNVQDVFRAHNLFSKFSVSCVDEIGPVRILSVSLRENPVFGSETGPASTKEALSFPSLPTNYTFRVFRKQDAAPSSGPFPRTLNLVITYSVLNEEVVAALETLVARKLAESNLLKYLRLMLPAFARLKYDTMAYGMTGEIPLKESFLIGSWEQKLQFIDEEDAIKLLAVIKGIFESGKDLKYNSQVGTALREITIPVEIPSIHVLHTVDLSLLPSPSETNNGDEASTIDKKLTTDFLWTVGKPVQIKVEIQSTRAWCGIEPYSEDDGVANAEYSYEVIGDSETWLIAGPKKGHVPLKDSLDGQSYKFNISLIPLRSGHWLLPTIGIAPFNLDGASISMETDYLANGVVAAIQTSNQSTSFTIDFSAPPRW